MDTSDIQSLIAQFQPTEADKDAARRQAMVALGLGLMGARRGQEFGAIGQAGLGALGAYNSALQNAANERGKSLQEATQAMALQQALMNYNTQKNTRDATTAYYASHGLGGTTLPSPATNTPNTPTPATTYPLGTNPALPPANPALAAVNPSLAPRGGLPSKADRYNYFLGLAQNIAAHNGDPSAAMKMAEAYKPKIQEQRVLTDDSGQRVVVNVFDDGTSEIVPGLHPDKEKAVQINNGKIMYAANPYDLQPVPGGATIQMQTTPGEDLTAQVAREGHLVTERGQNMQDARSRELNSLNALVYDPERGMLVNKHGGPAQPVLNQQGVAIGPKDADQFANQAQGRLAMADTVMDAIKQSRKLLQEGTAPQTGLTGAALGNVPGTEAYTQRALVTTIKSNLGFEQLAALRAASPTGGALGSVSDMENKLLASSIANLDPNLPRAAFEQALNNVEQHLAKVRQLIDQNTKARSERLGAPALAPSQQVPTGAVVDWAAMKSKGH